MTTPLRDMLKHDERKWNEKHTHCLKNVIDANAALDKRVHFYHPQRLLYLQVDASSHELGAALMQTMAQLNSPPELSQRRKFASRAPR